MLSELRRNCNNIDSIDSSLSELGVDTPLILNEEIQPKLEFTRTNEEGI